MAAKVTSIEVARRAGVSQSAVSRVFTPGASASQKTEALVRKAAEELGYRPNVLARAIASGKSRIIGLVVAYLDNHFYPEVLEKLSTTLQNRGYQVMVFMASETLGNIDKVVDEVLDFQVDGLVLASVGISSELAKRCAAAGVPVVLFNRRQRETSASSVTADNFEGGRQVANLLAEDGHKRVGYIAGWEGASTQQDREAGFRQGLFDCDLVLCVRGVGNFKMDEAREAGREMFSRSDRPDAVFVANDHMAFGVMDVLRFELGLSVPGDVAIVGYDDVPTASWPGYDLTTVRQRTGQMVDHCVSILLEQIDAPDTVSVQEIALRGPLVRRGTTRNLNHDRSM